MTLRTRHQVGEQANWPYLQRIELHLHKVFATRANTRHLIRKLNHDVSVAAMVLKRCIRGDAANFCTIPDLCNKLKKTKNQGKFTSVCQVFRPPLTLVSDIRFCSPVSVGFPCEVVNLYIARKSGARLLFIRWGTCEMVGE